MKNPTVWIVKEQMLRNDVGSVPMDYSPAMQYGDIEFITQHDMPMYGKSSAQSAWNEDVNAFVIKYDPAFDYIITTGQPMAILAVGFALGRAGKCPRFLVWRREESRYRPVHFDASLSPA
ncbi:hypothetical protein UFOVP2_8 [uncultured Caudovirales phage]|uniref:Uncharacterized protein n=1 Tax=uncultured Caudovirales phage TaxID=2100421 RepID=A0A6J5KKA5_9CAUD|nr:hypothetical protein UFOVP2_8 [uncultured Caudovirales phage]